MKTITASVLIIVLVVAFVAYRQMKTGVEVERTAATPAEMPHDAAQPVVAPVSQADAPVPQNTTASPQRCLSPADVASHPMQARVLSAGQAASTNGVDVENFRGLDAATVRGFAEQGDTAAMAVMGAIAVAGAYRVDESRAVEWLTNDGEMDGIVMQQQQLSADASLALNDAAYWFYEAALNGRVQALARYGQVRAQLFGGPVGMSWIDSTAFAELPPAQKEAYAPARLYGEIASRFAPSIDTLPGASVDTDPAVELLLDELEAEFREALNDAGLPTPGLNPAELAELQALVAARCPPDDESPQVRPDAN